MIWLGILGGLQPKPQNELVICLIGRAAAGTQAPSDNCLYPLPHVHVQRLLQQGLATRDILAIEKNQAANSLGNKNMDNETLELLMVKKINESWVDEDKRRKNRASLRKELEWIRDGD